MAEVKIPLYLKDIIAYVEGKNQMNKLGLLASVTVTALMIANPSVGATASAAYTLLGSSVSSQIKKILDMLDSKNKEDQAIEVFERCTFTEILLSRLAVKQTIEKNLNGKDMLFAQWKLSRTFEEEQKKEISRLDEERENKFVQTYLDKGSFNKDNYWDELLEAILKVLDISTDEIINFKKQMIEDISHNYRAFNNQVAYESQLFNNYVRNTEKYGGKDVIERLNELIEFMGSYGNLYKTIDEVEQWLKVSTDPSIGLNFFNYEEDDFEKQFIQQLSNEVIYLKGKTREEVVYYTLFILKKQVKNREQDTYIIDTKENWDALKGKCKDKILIPNFNASVVDIIPYNTNIIIYSDEDYLGNKQPIELNKRILSNMSEMLQNEIKDLALVNRIVDKSNGLYTTFKRMVFKGKSGYPKWEEHTNRSFIPALLIGSWTESDTLADREILSKLAHSSYEEYVQSISKMVGGEDSFLITYKNYRDKSYKLANVEEAWEIIFHLLTPEVITTIKDVIVEVLTDVAPMYQLPVEEHYRGTILDKGPKYSENMKKGMISSLIMLANMDGKDNHMNIRSTQHWVDGVVLEVLGKIDSREKWFAISEYMPMIAEASPDATLTVLEREVILSDSPFWQLFEQNGDGFWGRNYYTHILWALEKLLCLEETALRVVKVLAKLSEREVDYPISNSPISTLHHALCAWLHDINISIDEKIQLTDFLVKRNKIGWELLVLLLPDRTPGRTMMSMMKPHYRQYKMNYKLTQRKEIIDTYKAYSKIAIREAKVDLYRWGILFDKFFFFELGLADDVIVGATTAIEQCSSDEAKYEFKEKVREILYRHRFYCKSHWAVREEHLLRIEQEVYDTIKIENKLYNYLHLFTIDKPITIHPEPYQEKKYDYNKERDNLREIRRYALGEIQKDPDLKIMDLLLMLNENHQFGRRAIGEIVASDFHGYTTNSSFIAELLAEEQTVVLLAYVGKIYEEKGIQVILNVLEKVEDNLELQVALLKIAEIDEVLVSLVDSFGPLVVKRYWEILPSHIEVKEETVRQDVWNNLLEAKNYPAAVIMLNHNYFRDIPKHIELLTKMLNDPGDNDIYREQYHIRRAFQHIYEVDNLIAEERVLVRKLEWAYFQLLMDEITPRYLTHDLKTDPNLMSELIRYVFKSSDESVEPRELTENETNIAKQAFSILFKLKFCPCVDEEGSISVEELTAWTKQYLELVDNNKQSIIGQQKLGECFSQSPNGKDGFFPHEAVREVFENHYSDEIKRGFVIGINNNRGVYTITNGEGEKKLSAQYEMYAKAVRLEYPLMAGALKEIADDYMRQSRADRERASHDL
ncbi:hypothetical protein [Sporosarcina sp. FSL K6-5500]|uniref:hypothetical protein n=1 Tax=Sporosarcina sp. FSL K6-5500 TaxID=2921558 RepID=UPI0030F8FFD8